MKEYLCGSFSCTGVQIHVFRKKDYVAKIPKNGMCPDCGGGLYVPKFKNRRHTVKSRQTTKVLQERDFNLNQF